MEQTPIHKVGEFLLVSIQVDMHDRQALILQNDLTTQVVKTRAKGVLIDISTVFCVAKVWCESIYFRYTFASLFL